ncbi:RPM1-interacting protein 4-like [Rhodamnia argentea]|uniref:RPM1-interacting protein 4-like n=1 Tax=Rhodamnia argentea TaxID=178133 RepID=A0ABM3GTT5_9MYRT|nr:RPM1-interacting protein 4-like [Rhodamnia argentea]
MALLTFGNWEDTDTVPYTTYFERARKGKPKWRRLPGIHRKLQSQRQQCQSTSTTEVEMKLSEEGSVTTLHQDPSCPLEVRTFLHFVAMWLEPIGSDSRVLFYQPNHCTTIPKLGDWDETNLSSADGYTHGFNRVVEEKKGAARTTPATATETPHSNDQHLLAHTRSDVSTGGLKKQMLCIH